MNYWTISHVSLRSVSDISEIAAVSISRGCYEYWGDMLYLYI
jgi:hypothetical protein